MALSIWPRKLPCGAEVIAGEGAAFRVWAPRCRHVSLVFENEEGRRLKSYSMTPEKGGYHSVFIPEARIGTFYRYLLEGDENLYPDPYSRHQPLGPHGPSCVCDSSRFPWTDEAWHGLPLKGQVIYEMHMGTFTKEGTYQAALRELPELKDVGITVIELMPLAEFPGKFGWGYDGVDLFAPTQIYGSPDDLRAFVDRAHSLGMAVIQDVVYNHLGPDGNYLKVFSEDYFTDRYKNEWGEALNFDGPGSEGVREFIVSNALYWIDEFHMDGLRLDATQQIFDCSKESILAEMNRRLREAAGNRMILLIGENEPQNVKLLHSPKEGGCGLDALWNDDFHHCAKVAVTGKTEAYLTDYRGTPQEFISALKWGYLYQGQWYHWQKKRRGTPAFDVAPEKFVNYIQNHDQIANSSRGERLHLLTSPGRYRALTAILLLAPATPMLFQGQEFAASTPFFYFADHHPALAKLVRRGRFEFVSQFPSIASLEMSSYLPDPENPRTFEACKLDFTERKTHAEAYVLHRDLLRLRREDPVFSSQNSHSLDGAVLGFEAFVIRFFGNSGNDRLLLVNFGQDFPLTVLSEPLLAPPEDRDWEILWSSEHPRYGGQGTPALDTNGKWILTGHAALVLKPVAKKEGVPHA